MHGLHCSAMERLLNMPAYLSIPSAARACCKLTKNYRSHPQLVKMLSRLSYSNRLEAHAPSAKARALLPCRLLTPTHAGQLGTPASLHALHSSTPTTPPRLPTPTTPPRLPRVPPRHPCIPAPLQARIPLSPPNLQTSNPSALQTRHAQVNALQDWGKSGTERAFPMLFVSLEGGSEEREGDSPSWFNRQEAHVLQELVVDLMRACEAKGLKQEAVGVITPCFKQP